MSTNALFGQMSLNPANPTLGVTGTGVTFGNSYGTSTTFSPGLGASQANGAANGFGNSTATQIGGVMTPSSLAPEITFGSGFGNFAASGGSVGVFGSPLVIPGTGSPGTPAIPPSDGTEGSKGGQGTPATPGTPAVPATPPSIVPGLQTGGGAGGFGFTMAGGVGNVSGDIGTSLASGTAFSSGFGASQGSSLFGTAGGNGGGSSDGVGGGSVGPSAAGIFGISAFNGNGGGLASGGGGAYVGFNPPTPVILGAFSLAGP
jgi:hypothetical protein